MEQVCSIKKCHANIVIQEGQKVAMFDGKPVCNKCDRFLHAPLPTITKLAKKSYRYEEPEAYKQEVVNDGRDVLDYPAYLPIPRKDYGVRRIQVLDKNGNMHFKYIHRYVGSTGDQMEPASS